MMYGDSNKNVLTCITSCLMHESQRNLKICVGFTIGAAAVWLDVD